ncbi:amidohydrolase family protein [Streptomyces sp. NPDC047081]|uniref:amidohydrolase family protein n=1 Tax=Streptomyces sp. NPDC047081 TaxID=3154706 RepID=UPI0033E2EAE7
MSRNRIDVHSHYFGGSVRRLFDSGFRLAGNYRISAEWTPAAALDFMDRHEIAVQFLSTPWLTSGTEDEPERGVNFCRAVNEEFAVLIADYPQRFGAFAAIPGDGPDEALNEIAYALDDLGLDGVLLTSNIQGRYLGEPSVEPILAELARRRVPVFLHPTDGPTLIELGRGRPSSVVEFPFDTARSVTNALYTGVFQRYPGLSLILAHCGGALPQLGWRIAEHTEMGRGPQDASINPAHVTEVLRGLYYETALAGGPHSLLPTLQVTQPSNILFGTDWPAAPERTAVHNTENLMGFKGLTTDEIEGIERGNALTLFPRFRKK